MDARHLAGLWTFKELWGFSAVPPEDAKIAYMKALLICAHGDNDLAAAEREWVVGYAAALGYTDEHLQLLQNFDPKDNINELSAIVHSHAITAHPESKMGLLYDSIRAAASDAPLNDGELGAIKNMAQMLGVSGETIDKLQSLYNNEMTEKLERIKACFPSGMPY